jgi:hypothetical protein
MLHESCGSHGGMFCGVRPFCNLGANISMLEVDDGAVCSSQTLLTEYLSHIILMIKAVIASKTLVITHESIREIFNQYTAAHWCERRVLRSASGV